MKNLLDWLPMLAWSAISLAPPSVWAQVPNMGNVVEFGSLKSRVPADWVQEKPDNPQRYKQYRLEPVNDDKDDAQVTIRFLGKSKGDTATEYVSRARQRFLPPEGKKTDVAKVVVFKVSGAEVTYVSIVGDYKGIPGDPATPRQNLRLLGVYFETAKGPYIIELLGPADTVQFYRAGFEDWVKAFK
jgi:hypothetical protein